MKVWSKLKHFILMRNKVQYARFLGVTVGDNCRILANPKKAFGSEPYLISLGNHVEVTDDVQFITHDGGVWTLREKFSNIDVFGPIIVGNNVFIGHSTVILPNVNIGDNVVIGAGSIVTKDLKSNFVYAGVPAKIIKTFEEYASTSLVKASYTHGMSSEQKQGYLKKEKPEWFIRI